MKHLAVAAMLIVGAVIASAVLISESLAEGQPMNGIGSGSEDWWITSPAQSMSAGSVVTHPPWVLDALLQKPVLIYVHKGCSYCKPQTEAMAEVVSKYKDDLLYFDISAGGQDARAMQAVTAYDPNGGVSYVPLTAIITLASGSDGKVKVVWHSSEEVTGKTWIEEYVKDAINYHQQNSGNWKKSEVQRSVDRVHI